MTINNPNLYLDGVWDWGILRGCFGTSKIEPTDLDGIVERKGHFLVLETKKPGVKISQGQMLTFNSMHNTGLFTIVVIWGENNDPQKMMVIYPPPLQVKQGSATINDLRRVVKWWYKKANVN